MTDSHPVGYAGPMPDADATHVQTVKVQPPEAVMPSLPGFEVKSLLGQGGMGKVYLAQQKKLQRLVAIKLVTASNDEHALARFDEEVKAIASLKHQHIAQIFESGQCDGKPFYAMEYVAGGTLSDKLKTNPLPPRDAATLVAKLARAMAHAHEQGVIHRDLKPSNVLLEAESLEPKIADFGLAKRLGDASNLTRTGDIFGSPSYMAPEQASGVMTLTPSVDVYALGAILYECVTGRPPFLASEPMLTLMQVLSSDPVPPVQLQPKLPRDLNTICMKCLEKQPKKRYGSAAELAEDLERYLKGEPIAARPVGWVERVVKYAKRRPWQAVAAGLAGVLFVGAIVAVTVLQMAYLSVKQSNHISNRSFELSEGTLEEVLRQYTNDLSTMPRTEGMVIKALESTVTLFDQLHALRPDHLPIARKQQQYLEQFFIMLVQAQRYAEAEKAGKQAMALVKEEQQRRPDEQHWHVAEARTLINQAWMLRHQNKAADAVPLERQALTLLERLTQQTPDDLELLKRYNDLLQSAIADDIAQSRQGDIKAREQHIGNAVSKYRQIVDNWVRIDAVRKDVDSAALLMASRKSLATVLVAVNQIDEAEKIYRDILTQLERSSLPDRERSAMLTHAQIDLSDIARRRQQYDQSLDFLKQATAGNQALRSSFPQDHVYLFDSYSIRQKTSQLLHDQGQTAKAVELLRQTLREVEELLKKQPTLSAVDELRKNMATLLARYENEASPPRGKE